ncbi:MAG: MMPL family transporter [Actinobacteria bacterium]|nr:MMPL family transporter [Actinomycetota bacterium]
MSRIASVITGARTAWMVALVTFLLALAVAGALPEGERDPSPLDALPAGYDSTEGTALLSELPEDESSSAIVLYTSDGGIEAELPALQQLSQQVAPDTGGQGPPVQVVSAQDGTAAIAVLAVPAVTATETADQVGELRDALGEGVPDGVTAQVTGPAAIQADLAAVFDGANVTLLITTASVVAVLLLVTYRSPILWIIPLAVVGLGDRVAGIGATNVLELTGVPFDESTVGILSVLVFGAGTDYSLLLISRYRDELKNHASRHEAMLLALRRTAEAVFASSSTVFLGLLTLLLSVVPSTRGLGLACAVGIVVAATFALVLLPAVLVIFGRWVFWPLIPRLGQPVLADGRSIWRRVGNAVEKRPPAFIIGTLAVLAVMCLGVFRIDLGLSTSEQFLEEPEAITAANRLADSFPAGSTDPTVVVTRSTDQGELAAIEEAALSVDSVDEVRQSGQAAGITTFDVVLSPEPGSSDAVQAIGGLRGELEGAAPPETHVTGIEAETADIDDGAARDRQVIFPLILGLVLVALIGLLRSVVAPILLITTVAFTYVCALGVSWWLFTGVFGFSALDAGVPLLAFIFLVALGVDYNIFLVTRALEEARTVGSRTGMLRALAATGGVITSAEILLAAVFAALGVLPLVVLAQLGVVIFVGVLIDTLIVRTVLVPAIGVTMGDAFWWPRSVRPPKHGAETIEARIKDPDDELVHVG